VSKGGNKVEETPQQRAMTEFALKQLQDYKARWLPVQRNLATQIQSMGQADSAERRGVSGRAATDTSMRFAQAEGALEKTLSNNGVGLGSSRGKLAISGMGEDQAKTRGLGLTMADQQIDDAYMQGLQALTAIGRGERANVAQGLNNQAQSSAQTAAASAEASAMNRGANAQLAGTTLGYGLQRSLSQLGPNMPQPAYSGTSPVVLGQQADNFTTNPQAGW